METIFVVDDNSVNLLKAEAALLDHYEVITIASASIMFELFDDIIPDLILLDIMMPGMNGFDALKLLKANKQYAEIPVIFLTSKNDAATRALSFEMGVADFIEKPFSEQILLERIKTVLSKEPQIIKCKCIEENCSHCS